MTTKISPCLQTAEILMRELIESSRKFEKLFDELIRSDRTSKTAFDLLSDLWVEAEVIRSKAEHSKEELDAVLDALPDD
jgi:hypothetical protein